MVVMGLVRFEGNTRVYYREKGMVELSGESPRGSDSTVRGERRSAREFILDSSYD